jgi:hypothetical protein
VVVYRRLSFTFFAKPLIVRVSDKDRRAFRAYGFDTTSQWHASVTPLLLPSFPIVGVQL